MLHKIILIIMLFGTSPLLWAQAVEVNPDHPDQYIVQEGDTLWDISARFLVEPWRWPEIWQVNPQIENPHLIYPGDIVSLSYDGDTPVLTVQRGEGSDRTVRLSPSIRAEARDRAIHTIPIDAIRSFLTRPLIVGEDEMQDWPYVVSSYEQHLVMSPGIETYVRDLDPDQESTSYAIYRRGPAYVTRVDGKEVVLGYEAIYVGDAEITAFGDPATISLSNTVMEVMEGDRLLPRTEDEVYSRFIPSTPDQALEGSIISARNVLTEIGQYQVVVLDRGTAHGVVVGNVLGAYQQGEVVMDPYAGTRKSYDDSALINYLGRSKSRGEPVVLPETRSGVVMVFRTFDQVSYALVMEALRPLHIGNTVKGL